VIEIYFMQLVLSTPVLYSLELTPLCNNKCPGCFNVFIDDKVKRPMGGVLPPLTAAQWHTILTKIQPYVERVKLTGGEPTLHPEFDAIVQSLADLNISFSLFTNARWRKPDQLITLLKAIPQFTGFLISLHGADAETHEAYSGIHGSFDETVANIRCAVNAGLGVATSTVISRQNYGKLADIIALSTALGADHAVVNRYLGSPLPDIEPSNEELQIAMRTVERLRRDGVRVKFGNCVPQCFVANSSTGCLAGVAYCAISPWGELRPCNHSPAVAGNLLTQSVEEVWRSAKMEAWRGLMPNECETECSAFSTCHGACRALIELRGEHRDPLRGAPIKMMPHKPTERVTFYEGLRPIGNYHLRQEEFGYVALRGNRVVPISTNDYTVLQMCDGTRTLRQIQDSYGQNGLRTIAILHKKGLIEFVNETKIPMNEANVVGG
jgi:radical SAM protein with 4Fe4S-binding SPASM domain